MNLGGAGMYGEFFFNPEDKTQGFKNAKHIF